MNTPKKNTTIKIFPVGNQGIEISFSANVKLMLIESGRVLCYIDGLNIFFDAANKDAVKVKAIALASFYFDNFMKYEGKNTLKKLTLDLRQKGFTAIDNTNVVSMLVKNKLIKAKFTSTRKTPVEFENSPSFNIESRFHSAAVA